jgi:hypothetical protein
MTTRNRAIEATLTLPGIARPVGRPRKPDALSGAQRQKLYRQRQLAQRLERFNQISVTPGVTEFPSRVTEINS